MVEDAEMAEAMPKLPRLAVAAAAAASSASTSTAGSQLVGSSLGVRSQFAHICVQICVHRIGKCYASSPWPMLCIQLHDYTYISSLHVKYAAGGCQPAKSSTSFGSHDLPVWHVICILITLLAGTVVSGVQLTAQLLLCVCWCRRLQAEGC